jgi:predicted aspartyl protease
MSIEGYFNQHGEPVITLDLLSNSIEILIDTGFAGSLIIPETLAKDLVLTFEGVEEFYRATGEMFTAPAYSIAVDWFGERSIPPIAISAEIKEALLGTRML